MKKFIDLWVIPFIEVLVLCVFAGIATYALVTGEIIAYVIGFGGLFAVATKLGFMFYE